MSFAVYNDQTAYTLSYVAPLVSSIVPQIVGETVQGTVGQIDTVTAGDITTLSLANPITTLTATNLFIPIGGNIQFKGGVQPPVANYVLTCLDANGTVEWAPGGTTGSTFTNITVSNQGNFNLMDFQYNTTTISSNQVLATDNTAAKNVISIPFTSANTATTLVERDGSGNFSAGTVTFANVIDSGLTASQAVVTNGTKQLTSLAYTNANTASTLVERDGTGSFAAGTVTTTGFALTTGATNGYILTSNAGGTASWTAPATNVSSITGTANQITASAPTGAVTLSLPATVNLTNVNVSGLTASQAVVTDGTKNLVSLPYASTNTASSLVERDGTGSFAAGTVTTTGFALTTGATNGYILTSNAGGTASWTAPTAIGVSSITGTANQITASAPTGAVTLSLPTTVNLTNVNVSSLSASQAVVTDASKNLVSLAYTNNNTPSTLIARDNTGSFNAQNMSLFGLTASQAVVTNGSSQLVSLAYTNNNTPSTIVSRDGTGSFNAQNMSLLGLTPSQAVVTNGTSQLVSLAYTNNNTASTLVSRDGTGNFAGNTITAATGVTISNGGNLTVGGSTTSANTLTYNGFSLQNPNAGTAGSVLTLGTNSMTWTPTASLISSGTFTPRLQFGGTSGTVGITYALQQGYYTVIGAAGNGSVTIYIGIILTSKGTSTGTVYIDQLPYNYRLNTFNQTLNVAPYGVSFPVNCYGVSTGFVVAQSGPGTIALYTVGSDAFGGVPLSNTLLSNTAQFLITGTYLI